jgi:RNA polymerase sigma-70 factor (ECF subfamily)
METASTWEPDTEDVLMSDFGHGEVRAAEELFLRFAPRIFGFGLRTFEDADVASDLVEDTFVRLWRRAGRFSSRSVPLDTWVDAHAVGEALRMILADLARRETGASTLPRRSHGERVRV